MKEELKRIFLLKWFNKIGIKQKRVVFYFGASFIVMLLAACSDEFLLAAIAGINMILATRMINGIDIEE